MSCFLSAFDEAETHSISDRRIDRIGHVVGFVRWARRDVVHRSRDESRRMEASGMRSAFGRFSSLGTWCAEVESELRNSQIPPIDGRHCPSGALDLNRVHHDRWRPLHECRRPRRKVYERRLRQPGVRIVDSWPTSLRLRGSRADVISSYTFPGGPDKKALTGLSPAQKAEKARTRHAHHLLACH